eukprot:scaffold54898_cov63-Phaeocystis_antarctica.AAC.2
MPSRFAETKLMLVNQLVVEALPRKAMTVVSDPGSLSRTACPSVSESYTTLTFEGGTWKYSHAACAPCFEISMAAQSHASIAPRSRYAIVIASCSSKFAASSFQCVSSMCDLCQLSALDVSAVKLLAQDAAPSDPHQLVHHAPSQVVPRAMSVHRPAPPQVGNCPGQVQDRGGGGNDGGELGGGEGNGGGGLGDGGGGLGEG